MVVTQPAGEVSSRDRRDRDTARSGRGGGRQCRPTIEPLEGQRLSALAAPPPIHELAVPTASGDRGDGTPPSPGTISESDGAGMAFAVRGSHTYAAGRATAYPITVVIRDRGGATLVATSQASVADAAPLVSGIPVRMTQRSFFPGHPPNQKDRHMVRPSVPLSGLEGQPLLSQAGRTPAAVHAHPSAAVVGSTGSGLGSETPVHEVKGIADLNGAGVVALRKGRTRPGGTKPAGIAVDVSSQVKVAASRILVNQRAKEATGSLGRGPIPRRLLDRCVWGLD
jgi:hypothetical protein